MLNDGLSIMSSDCGLSIDAYESWNLIIIVNSFPINDVLKLEITRPSEFSWNLRNDFVWFFVVDCRIFVNVDMNKSVHHILYWPFWLFIIDNASYIVLHFIVRDDTIVNKSNNVYKHDCSICGVCSMPLNDVKYWKIVEIILL